MSKVVKKAAKKVVKAAVKKPVAKPAAKKPVAKKVPAKKSPVKKAPVKKTTRRTTKVVEEIKPCKVSFTATEIVQKIAAAAGIEPKQVKAVMAWQQKFIIANLKKGGTGRVKLLGWTFKSVYKPASKGGVKKPNPFKPGEMMVTKPKAASMRAKALSMKAVKDGIAI